MVAEGFSGDTESNRHRSFVEQAEPRANQRITNDTAQPNKNEQQRTRSYSRGLSVSSDEGSPLITARLED